MTTPVDIQIGQDLVSKLQTDYGSNPLLPSITFEIDDLTILESIQTSKLFVTTANLAHDRLTRGGGASWIRTAALRVILISKASSLYDVESTYEWINLWDSICETIRSYRPLETYTADQLETDQRFDRELLQSQQRFLNYANITYSNV